MLYAERDARAGTTLLEVMVALTILATSAASCLALVAQSSRAVRDARRADAAMQEASAYLDVVTLWTRDDYDRHLGLRSQGQWEMRVDRLAPGLYEIALFDSSATRELVRTSVYRREPPRGEAP